MLLPTTLCMAAAAAVLNLWLALRIVRMRFAKQVLHGDGGEPLLLQRMRAQANFVENAPLALILIGAIEMSGRGGRWLPIVAAAFLLGRIGHAFGMDMNRPNALRAGGTLVTWLTLLSLAVAAVLTALRVL